YLGGLGRGRIVERSVKALEYQVATVAGASGERFAGKDGSPNQVAKNVTPRTVAPGIVVGFLLWQCHQPVGVRLVVEVVRRSKDVVRHALEPGVGKELCPAGYHRECVGNWRDDDECEQRDSKPRAVCR